MTNAEQEIAMRTLAAIMFAMLLTTGAAMAQEGGSGGEAAPDGINMEPEIDAMPTPQQCEQGWDASMDMTEAEFDLACDNQ